jgi:hypothetical protein
MCGCVVAGWGNGVQGLAAPDTHTAALQDLSSIDCWLVVSWSKVFFNGALYT